MARSINGMVSFNTAATLGNIFFVHMAGLVLQKTQSVPFGSTSIIFFPLLQWITLDSVAGESLHTLAATTSWLVQTHSHRVATGCSSFALIHIYTNSSNSFVTLSTVAVESTVLIDTNGRGRITVMSVLFALVDIY